MRSHIAWRGNKIFLIRVWKSFSSNAFKIMRLTTIRNRPKQTISTNSEFGLLQLVSKLDTERCANEDTRLPRGVDCEISHRLEKGTKHFL